MVETILSLKNLRKVYNTIVAVDNINLEIKEKEFFSLLGPSGCGKTTTLRLVGGFEKPDNGEILLKNQKINNLPPFKRDINTVFQNYALFPHFNVYKNIAYGLENRGFDKGTIKSKVTEILKMIKLDNFEKRRPAELSGGQQQRVALARALVNRPAILLLDEPLGALDLKIRKHMQLELKKIQKEVGITFIYVTHDQEEALTLSDRIAVMNNGKLIQVGTPENIYMNPQTDFVADFIGEANILKGKIIEITSDHMKLDLGLESHIINTNISNISNLKFEVNGSIGFVLRPEDIKTSKIFQPSDGVNIINGKIKETVFKGNGFLYIIELKNGKNIRVLNSDKLSNFNNKNEIYLNWKFTEGNIVH